MYVGGCRPFPVLHKNRRLLRGPRAKTLRDAQHIAGVFAGANVLGMGAALDKVWGHLHSLKWHEVLTLWICRTSPLLFCFRAQGRGILRGAELGEVANRI